MFKRSQFNILEQWLLAARRHIQGTEFIFLGGYPGALSFKDNWTRFKAYIKDALIETVVAKDILMMPTVKKPALLRRVFDMGCMYGAQILSWMDKFAAKFPCAHMLLVDGSGIALETFLSRPAGYWFGL
jgi:hypothetical protein